MKTRDRILREARKLFNAQGYGRVTTASLAAAVGISEGNLWYHFNNKHELVNVLSDELGALIMSRLEMTPRRGADGDIVADYIALLDRYAVELREYRFLYRDQTDYGDHSHRMKDALPHYYAGSIAQLREYYCEMIGAGLLDWPDERLDDLAVNAAIIIRFSLEYYRESGQRAETGSGAVRRLFAQHLTLFEHRLQADAAQRLRVAVEAMAPLPSTVPAGETG